MDRTLRHARPVARKPYTCGLCGGTIQKGERYTLIAAIADGKFVVARHHDSGNFGCAEHGRAVDDAEHAKLVAEAEADEQSYQDFWAGGVEVEMTEADARDLVRRVK